MWEVQKVVNRQIENIFVGEFAHIDFLTFMDTYLFSCQGLQFLPKGGFYPWFFQFLPSRKKWFLRVYSGRKCK